VLKVLKVVQYVEGGLPDSRPLQLLCGNVPVPPTMTLSAVRAFVWKSSDELVLLYARAPPAAES
jgi:WD repeat-containing protein 48